jgi:hypothetical protein
MKKMNLNDDNVENTNISFISIIGTDECIKYWIGEDDKHYFKDHPNVLNLGFDDIDGCDVMYNGHLFKTMDIKQAETTVEFIERNIEKGINTVYIHCKAGISRSRAVGEFIYRYCMEHDIEAEYEDRDDYVMVLNHGVLRILNHVYWKKHNLKMYEDGNTEYPNDLINMPMTYINRPSSENNRKRGKV